MLDGYGDNNNFNKFKGFISHNIIEKNREKKEVKPSDPFNQKNKEEVFKEFFNGEGKVIKFN